MIVRLFNTGLRLGSLALKLVLTLYMGKYLGLTELGTFGLVSATVAIMLPVLGMRLDYIVGREIVDIDPIQTARKIKDQIIFYMLNYAILLVGAAIAIGGQLTAINAEFIMIAVGLSILESVAAITSGNIISLKQPVLANFLFFTRSASWVIPAIGLGLYDETFRNAETIFSLWFAGVFFSLCVTAFVWRKMPWKLVLQQPVDWGWLKSGLKITAPIWIGTVCAAAAGNIDRFIVEGFLGRDFVGIISFYASFTTAIIALLTAGIFSFTYPHLISMYKRQDTASFDRETRKMTIQATLSAAAICLILGGVIPFLGSHFDRPEFYEYRHIFWMMLTGVLIKSATESLYYVMYARGQDKAIWAMSFFSLASALGFNLLFVPLFGFEGVGYSSILSASVLSIYRYVFVQRYNKNNPEISGSVKEEPVI